MIADGMTAEAVSDREIVLTRLLNAPRERVFRVWTNPQHVAQWWGPNGFTTTVHEMDVRPGGVWRFIMHAPNGQDYHSKAVYHEVVEPERLVYDLGDEGEGAGAPFHVTVTFDEQDGKTAVTMRMVFDSVQECERVKAFGAVELGYQTLDRLAAHLASVG